MLMREFIDILVSGAKIYRNEKLIPIVLPGLLGKQIDSAMVVKIIGPFVAEVAPHLDDSALQKLLRGFAEFVPDAMESVKRNNHMNTANGSGILDEEHADALLVSFVNIACMPCDLALYTSDIQPG